MTLLSTIRATGALAVTVLAACAGQTSTVCRPGLDGDLDGRADCEQAECTASVDCHPCGDGHATGDQACDGPDLHGATCVKLGFAYGELRCTSVCALDTTGCRRTACGDGVVTGDEQCDDGNGVAGDCCAACRAEPGCEIEPDADPDHATPLPLGGTGGPASGNLRGVLGGADRVDLVGVVVPAATTGQLTATLLRRDGACPAAGVEILDASGAVVAGPPCAADTCDAGARTRTLAAGPAYVRVSLEGERLARTPYELQVVLETQP